MNFIFDYLYEKQLLYSHDMLDLQVLINAGILLNQVGVQ